jgi:hypothetical protein
MTKWLKNAAGKANSGLLIAAAIKAPVIAWLRPVTGLV